MSKDEGVTLMIKDNNVKNWVTGGTEKIADKRLPNLVNPKDSCCGCGACYNICPVDAIRMEPDSEGFLYPVIDPEKCIRCYRCKNVCAFKRDQQAKGVLAKEEIQ